MFRKLRIKFIAIVMASVAIVLAVVFTGICISEYQRSLTEVNSAMMAAIDRAVMISDDGNQMHKFDNKREYDNSVAGDQAANGEGQQFSGEMGEPPFGDESFEGMQPPRIGGRDGDRMRNSVPLAVYSVADAAEPVLVSEVTTASIDADVLAEASELVQASSDGEGSLSEIGLHYSKRTVDGTVYMAFADTTTTSNWESLALTLVIAGLGTLAVFFILSLFLSKWALRPVREAWDSQRQFVADASHDLKTPLTVILANASILLKHPDDSIASQSQWIESTQTEANTMQGLVTEMLELAQVEERAQLAADPVDFSDLIDGETLQFESLAFEQGCLFDGEIAEGITVVGDAGHLRKMASTLIENALKYVDEGGTVTVSLARSGKNAQLIVRNTGATIAPEDLPHIFDRFYRTDKARTSGAGGFGLGLAIARETARAHNGDITCTSTPDVGTTFTVTLPVAN